MALAQLEVEHKEEGIKKAEEGTKEAKRLAKA